MLLFHKYFCERGSEHPRQAKKTKQNYVDKGCTYLFPLILKKKSVLQY